MKGSPPSFSLSGSSLSPSTSSLGSSSESFGEGVEQEAQPACSFPANQNGKALAAFIGKLYSMLEDPRAQGLIRWSPGGGFLVENADEFAREVLPQYFKHNNFASFVRQLNMYGFHKVNDFVQQNQQEQQHWEFSHPSFQKGKKNLLFEIKRKVPSSSSKCSARAAQHRFQQERVEDISERVERLEGEVGRLQQSSASISNELLVCKQLIREQRLAINQLIQYLAALPASQREDDQRKRKLGLEVDFIRIDREGEQLS